jgi:hypothetical protein
MKLTVSASSLTSSTRLKVSSGERLTLTLSASLKSGVIEVVDIAIACRPGDSERERMPELDVVLARQWLEEGKGAAWLRNK